MKKIAYDQLKVDSLNVIEDSKCCLKVSAVITKEGVYKYPDGVAFKSRMELLRATRTARYAKLTVFDHPDSMVVMSQADIKGGVEKPFFERDKIRAVLNFDKSVCSPEFLDGVRRGSLKDVSIGFYYRPDPTPGTWKGQAYDYVMRDIMIDHVAAGVLKGRCSFPSCGIGVDTMMRRIALDPFASYKDFADCVSKNQDKDDPEAYCGSIKHKVEDSRVTNHGGKKNMSEEESGQTTPDEFSKCVAERMADGYTKEAAEAHCLAFTKPEDKPTPVQEPTGTDQEEEGGESDLTPFEQCVNAKMNEGIAREDAEAACRAEHPVAEEDQETEQTPMERCITNQKEQGKSDEEARTWCEAELAGEHEEAGDLIERSQELINMKQQRDTERLRESRRHPL